MIRRARWILPALAGPMLILLAGSAVFSPGEDAAGILLRSDTPTTSVSLDAPAAFPSTLQAAIGELEAERELTAVAAATARIQSEAAAPSTTDSTSPASNDTTTTTLTVATTTTTPASATTTTSSTTTSTTTATTPQPPPTTTSPPASNSSGLRLWDTAWQIAAKANEAAMRDYVDRLAAASGAGGGNLTGFWFSVVNINQDINTPNGFGHTFDSFSNPNPAYLDDVERLIAMAAERGLKVGIVVAWDGPNQFSVEHGKLTSGNGYAYGRALAERWTRPGFSGRTAIDAWIVGGDTTEDCCGGEHGAVWSEVVRGIEDAQAANGFGGPQILLHTAPGQHLNYVGAPWLDAHAPQTGHCADAGTAVSWMQELAATGATIWGNGEMRYESITWPCNGNVPISAQQVLDDTRAMHGIGLGNHAYGFDPRWNATDPGNVGMSGSGVSEGLQLILDDPGLVRAR